MTSPEAPHHADDCSACRPLPGRPAPRREPRRIPNPLRLAIERASSHLRPGAKVGTVVKRGSSAQLRRYAQVGCVVDGCPGMLGHRFLNPAGLVVCEEHWHIRPPDCEPPPDDRSDEEIAGVRSLAVLAGEEPEWWPLSRVPGPGERLRPELLDWIDDPDDPDSEELALRKEAVRIVATGSVRLDGATTPTFGDIVENLRAEGPEEVR